MQPGSWKMPDLTPVLEKEAIAGLVSRVAGSISQDYQNCSLVLIGVLKGAFIFLSDLVRCLTIPVQVDFIRVASYGAGNCSSGKIQLSKDLEMDVAGKDVLIVEDIVDTGLTLQRLVDHLKSHGPRSVKICTFIDKVERREVPIEPDYFCHRVEEGFLVGYGLDYAEDYRYLQGLYHLKF
jgi:hypoxanthine phosphoribosyltransferase